MRESDVLCISAAGYHRMHYTDWGDPDNERVLVCVHGLTRNGRDFDDLAQALSRDYRIVCPDIAGRGRSDWLKGKARYGYPQYMADMTVLLAKVLGDRVSSVAWLGTSMGGMLGMLMAAPTGSPIRQLILNDVGAFIPRAALERIGRYAGSTAEFDTFAALVEHLRTVCAPFGPLSNDQWEHLARHGARQTAEGRWTTGYDPLIAAGFREGPVEDVVLWPAYEAIRCPTMVIRGAESDLLSPETAIEMTQRGPRAQLVEIPGVGHAPMFMDRAQIDIVRAFLQS